MFTFFIISFVAGLLTVLAPCVLPVLPVIVGGTIAKGEEGNDKGNSSRRRAYRVIGALAASVFLFTLILKFSTIFIDIPSIFWKYLSGSVILLIGSSFLFDKLWTKIIGKSSVGQRAHRVLGIGMQKKNAWGDIIIGAALGPVFSTCSPTYFLILATVLPASLGLGMLYLLAFILGMSLVLLLITYLGDLIVKKLNILADPKGWFKKIIGVLFILIGIAIISGFDKKIEARLLDGGWINLTGFEERLIEKADPESMMEDASRKATEQEQKSTGIFPGYDVFEAPELVNPHGYINTDDQTTIERALSEGKIVLVDFWTYSCINCIRTIPYLQEWYEKYAEQGLEIIAVHTPEFAFEKKLENVEKAVKDFGITYPVVLDNDYETWRSYENRFWPRKYLIDHNGNVIYDHIGEGAYGQTERAIQEVLRHSGNISEDNGISDIVSIDNDTENYPKTPEIYLGAWRNSEYLINAQGGVEGTQILGRGIEALGNPGGYVMLDGTWEFTDEYVAVDPSTGGSILVNVQAQDIHMVAQSDTGAEIEYAFGTSSGPKKKITIDEEKLYTLFEDLDPQSAQVIYGDILHINIPKGVDFKIFTFTFG